MRPGIYRGQRPFNASGSMPCNLVKSGNRAASISRAIRASFVILLVLGAGGCSNPFRNGDCTGPGTRSVTVTITDSQTGRPPATAPSVLVEDGAYQDRGTFQESTNPLRISAGGIPGTFRVTVSAPGYMDLVVPSVVVGTRGRCNVVDTQTLTVGLVRVPAP